VDSLTVEVVTALLPEVMVVRTALVVYGVLEPPAPPAPAVPLPDEPDPAPPAPVEMAVTAPVAVTPAAGNGLVMLFARECRAENLTRADGGAVGKDLGVDWVTAGLDRAVTETVSEVGVAAVASGVASRAAELSIGDLDHVRNALLL
jgi:hypothetical protein